ncbi:hypothetical protein DEU32_10829 [Curtobacterium sp. AG1037]|nr:hypothetical protein DEU32_10829 [Curtobacterium sp. AG1037]
MYYGRITIVERTLHDSWQGTTAPTTLTALQHPSSTRMVQHRAPRGRRTLRRTGSPGNPQASRPAANVASPTHTDARPTTPNDEPSASRSPSAPRARPPGSSPHSPVSATTCSPTAGGPAAAPPRSTWSSSAAAVSSSSTRRRGARSRSTATGSPAARRTSPTTLPGSPTSPTRPKPPSPTRASHRTRCTRSPPSPARGGCTPGSRRSTSSACTTSSGTSPSAVPGSRPLASTRCSRRCCSTSP